MEGGRARHQFDIFFFIDDFAEPLNNQWARVRSNNPNSSGGYRLQTRRRGHLYLDSCHSDSPCRVHLAALVFQVRILAMKAIETIRAIASVAPSGIGASTFQPKAKGYQQFCFQHWPSSVCNGQNLRRSPPRLLLETALAQGSGSDVQPKGKKRATGTDAEPTSEWAPARTATGTSQFQEHPPRTGAHGNRVSGALAVMPS